MKSLYLLTILFIFVCANEPAAQIKRKNSAKKPTAKSKIKTKNISKGVIVSCGVCNRKATDLVAPVYPTTARAVRASGPVGVSIVIDESGKVIEAEAYNGHSMLRPSAVTAALASKFEPMTLNGVPVKMRGVITYNFSLDMSNWLEIGNALGGPSFVKMLPPGFEEEKLLYEQYRAADMDRNPIFQNLLSSIENKLGNDPKNLWLFRVGRLIEKIENECCRTEDLQISVAELKIFLTSAPEKVSPVLIKKLAQLIELYENPKLNTYTPSAGSRFYRQLTDIVEKLPLLGN